MEMSDESVSFGDFSGLEKDDYQRVFNILHGGDSRKKVEFPWHTDPNYVEGSPIQPGYCPVDQVPPIAGAPIFVPQFAVPAGIGYAVPAVPVVAQIPIVNGLPLAQPYPQHVAVPPENMYPRPEGRHLASPNMVSPPNHHPGGPGMPIYNQDASRVNVHGQVNSEPELDFVYRDPEPQQENFEYNQNENSIITPETPLPSDIPNTSNVENKVENLSIENDHLSDSKSPETKDKTPEPDQPAKKSWAGLFKGSVSNAIVTYVEEDKHEPSPQLAQQAPAYRVQQPPKMPVPVTEDSAAVKLGEMLKTVRINHNAVALQLRGLINRGNWCYINSTLQALLACPPFYHLMKQLSEFPPLINRGSSSTPILDSLIAFIKNFSPWVRNQSGMRGGKRVPELASGAPMEPVNVYRMLQVIEANPSFKHGKQEDAEEFLNCILDGLHEEMSTAIGQTGTGEEVQQQQNGFEDKEAVSEEEEEAWEQVGPKQKTVHTRRATFAKTPIADIFAGHLRSAVFKATPKESATLEPFFTLKLDIQDEKIWTVKDALDGLVSREAVQGYQCSKTNQEVEVVKKISMEELPPVLILHLKCFVFDKTGGSQKLLKKIDFDVDLNITKDWLSATAKARIQQLHRGYKLFAAVFHHGKNSTGGHYTTDVFHPGINSWVHIDDSRMQSVPVSAVLKYTAPRMPYLLYYRRTDLSS